MNQRGFAHILIIVGIISFILVVGGVYYIGELSHTTVPNQPTQFSTPQAIASIAPSPTLIATPMFTQVPGNAYSGWKTYTNTQYGFEFSYPTFMQLEDTSKISGFGSIGFIPLCYSGDLVCLLYPSEHLPQLINFEGAALSVSVEQDISSKEACYGFSGGEVNSPTPITINGVEFYTQQLSAPGATGHSQEDRNYQTYHNSECLSIQIGTDAYRCDGQETDDAKTGNSYCDGKPMVNDGKILDELTQVVDTFKFTK